MDTRLGTVFTVSPVYLRPLFKHSQEFNFNFQGYPDFRQASEGLFKTNIEDITAFLIVLELFEDDLTDFATFISRISLMETDTPVILAHNDKEAYDHITRNNLLSGYLRNINLTVLFLEDIVTDTFIRREFFGLIALSTQDAYGKFEYGNEAPYRTLYRNIKVVEKDGKERYKDYYTIKKRDTTVKQYSLNKLEFNPILDEISVLTLENIIPKQNLDATIRLDKYIRQLEEYPLNYDMRKLMMAIAINDETAVPIYNNIIDKIEKSDSPLDKKVAMKGILYATIIKGSSYHKKLFGVEHRLRRVF